MQDELINRQAVINAIANTCFWLSSDNWEELINCINSIPLVNSQPKTGHWVDIDEEPHEDYECDRCGYIISTYTANIEPHTEYKYCPNCGVKMVEPEESEDKEWTRH